MHFVVYVAAEEDLFDDLRCACNSENCYGDCAIENYVNNALEPFDQSSNFIEEKETCYSCDGAGLRTHSQDNTAGHCSNCDGTGEVTREYNPHGIYDWYVIGGRWNGVLCNPTNNEERCLFSNVMRVSDIHKNNAFIPQHLVDENTCLVDNPEDWLTDPANSNKYVVLVDCHS